MATPTIAKVTLPHGSTERKLEIIRETGEDADWHNRYVRDAETKVSS